MSMALTEPGDGPAASPAEVQLDPGPTADLEATYERLVLDRLDERYLVVDHAISAQSAVLATRVCAASGTAHDVIEVHVSTLRRMTADAGKVRAAALLDAGEHVLLLTLGHLAERYRSMALIVV